MYIYTYVVKYGMYVRLIHVLIYLCCLSMVCCNVVNILVDGDLAVIHRYKLSKVNYLLSSAWY